MNKTFTWRKSLKIRSEKVTDDLGTFSGWDGRSITERKWSLLALEPMTDELIPKNPTFFLSREVPKRKKNKNFHFFAILGFWIDWKCSKSEFIELAIISTSNGQAQRTQLAFSKNFFRFLPELWTKNKHSLKQKKNCETFCFRKQEEIVRNEREKNFKHTNKFFCLSFCSSWNKLGLFENGKTKLNEWKNETFFPTFSNFNWTQTQKTFTRRFPKRSLPKC
jgi:hypothetical protein